ncbi:hypothetical protein [uncultured Nostoc sp.]|uniref:hypothetical protein n=1 Tax=uncultured Nostoc sp. TaxID=340711 RepID=UPI0035CC9C47
MQKKETLSEKLGWISKDKDNAWFDTLNHAALNLIRQYAIMAVDLTKQDIYSVPLCNILCTVQTFSWDDLILPPRNRLVICQSAGDLFNTDLIVDIDSWLEPNASASLPPPSLIGSQKSTPSPTTCACNNFVTTCTNNKVNYVAASAVEEKELTLDLAREITELLQHQEFAPRRFCLDTLHPPPLLTETADAIGMRYGRLNLWAKIKLHIDQMKCEIKRLAIFVQQGYNRIKALESEMKYIETLEKARKDQVRIIKGICNQERAKRRAVAEWQDVLKASLTLLDESEDKTLVCLRDKRHTAQGAASVAPVSSTSNPAANGTLPQPEGSGASLSATLASRIFADTQANGIYEEFMNADDDI